MAEWQEEFPRLGAALAEEYRVLPRDQVEQLVEGAFGPGTTLDIPLGHKDAAFVRSHFDGMEVQINDAPRANEIMVAVAVTDSGRPLPRVGGLTVAEAKGEDGLR